MCTEHLMQHAIVYFGLSQGQFTLVCLRVQLSTQAVQSAITINMTAPSKVPNNCPCTSQQPLEYCGDIEEIVQTC